MNVRLAIKSEKIRIIDRHVYDYIQYSDSCLHRFRNTWEYEKLFNSFLLRSITDHHLEEECLSLIHISEPTRQAEISYAVFCLKKKNKHKDME